MEFDKWIKSQRYGKCSNAVEMAMRQAWEAGAKNEREKLLVDMDAADDCGCGVPCDCFTCQTAKYVIKARSNAKYTPPGCISPRITEFYP